MIINNIEFENAINDIDNKKIMRAACKKYKPFLSSDILENCRLVGMWKCLKYFQNSQHVKFTTALFNYVKWECQKEIEQKNKNGRNLSLDTNLCIISRKPNDGMSHVMECMEKLPSNERDIIKYRYLDGKTLQEISVVFNISKETARQRINKAVKKLKQICN